MPEVQAYKTTERRGETFSYLPAMTPDRLRQQISYLIAQGWNPAIEHTEPERTFTSFWYLWKLPFFGEKSVERILSELEACRRANPAHHVRLLGYDNYTQSQGTAFIVFRAGSR
jgi:ribulose-bisphosphate carboxylase small chain